jgi:hypothetical protein
MSFPWIFGWGGSAECIILSISTCAHTQELQSLGSLDYRWSWVIFDDVLLIITNHEKITKHKKGIHMGRRKKNNFVRSKNSAGGRNDTCNRRRMLAGGNVYGYGCWLEAIKRKTAVGDRIKFWCDLYCVSCNDYVCKMQTGKIWLGFFVASHVPTNVSLSPFCFRCHVPEPTNQATPVYLNSIQIVVWYIIDIFVRAMSYKEPGGVCSVRLEMESLFHVTYVFLS